MEEKGSNMQQMRYGSKKWLLLVVVILLGISLLFSVGCDKKSSDDSSKTDSGKSSSVDKSKDKDKNKDTTATDDTTALESEIIGPEWKLTEMAEDVEGADSAPIADNIEASITFSADGMYHAQGPVNIINGPFTLGPNNELTLGAGAMTRMAALDEDVAAAEDTFVAQLARVKSYKVLADGLSLYDDAHILILEFEK